MHNSLARFGIVKKYHTHRKSWKRDTRTDRWVSRVYMKPWRRTFANSTALEYTLSIWLLSRPRNRQLVSTFSHVCQKMRFKVRRTSWIPRTGYAVNFITPHNDACIYLSRRCFATFSILVKVWYWSLWQECANTNSILLQSWTRIDIDYYFHLWKKM